MSKQKLELTWIGKEKRPRLEPRILLEDVDKSYHAAFRWNPAPLSQPLSALSPGPSPASGRGEKGSLLADEGIGEGKESPSLTSKREIGEVGKKSPSPAGGRGVGERADIFDNRLIFGDNLLALKALEQEFTGKVKCVFIDPPYNTGSAFTHYDDGLEHSIWLGLMRDRLEIIRRLLSDDGSLWITIDDNEAHYLKVLCDEVFGRASFIASNIWQKRYSRENREAIGDSHDYVFVYAIDALKFKEQRNLLPIGEKQKSVYKNPDNDSRGDWQSVSLLAQGYRPNQMYEIVAPNGRVHTPPPGNCWKVIESEYKKLIADNRVYFGKDGNGVPRRKEFLSRAKGLVPWTWWPHEEVGHTDEAKKENHVLFGKDDPFLTPKPERLIHRILHIATNPGDLVLDSFAGSGTTGAVAHKMGRRWIMVELGEHCYTHIIPRLKKVIDGEDKGGITEAVGWQGGGGFRYYRLAPSLIVNDRWGNPVINPEYNAAQLAQALCKLEGFVYAPSETCWWQHGHSSERDFIYVTTQNLSAEQLQSLSEEVGNQSLLICCSAFRGTTAERWTNLTLKKIPKMVLARCEWGHDDYSLNVANLPFAAPSPPVPAAPSATAHSPAVPSPPAPLPQAGEGSKERTLDLFGDDEGGMHDKKA